MASRGRLESAGKMVEFEFGVVVVLFSKALMSFEF
jgi:hypothetical protein